MQQRRPPPSAAAKRRATPPSSSSLLLSPEQEALRPREDPLLLQQQQQQHQQHQKRTLSPFLSSRNATTTAAAAAAGTVEAFDVEAGVVLLEGDVTTVATAANNNSRTANRPHHAAAAAIATTKKRATMAMMRPSQHNRRRPPLVKIRKSSQSQQQPTKMLTRTKRGVAILGVAVALVFAAIVGVMIRTLEELLESSNSGTGTGTGTAIADEKYDATNVPPFWMKQQGSTTGGGGGAAAAAASDNDNSNNKKGQRQPVSSSLLSAATTTTTTVRPYLLSPEQLRLPEEVIDMRVMNYELPFDNPDGGAWKQGWELEPVNPAAAAAIVEAAAQQQQQQQQQQQPAATSTKNNLLQIFVVPHSHCDPGWIKTFDEYFRQKTSRIITTVVAALLQDPRRTFVWAEISYFSWWWEEQESDTHEAVLRLLRAGQLEFVTGGWVQPDEANSELYAMEVQLQEGHDWIRSTVGAEYVPTHGWAIDPFGYSPTAAYLWKRYNFTGMLIQRVHYAVKKELAKHKHLEFFWRQTWEDQPAATTAAAALVVNDPVNGQRIRPHDIFTHVMPFFSYDVPHTCGPDPAVCCQFDFGRLPGMGSAACPWHQQPQPTTAQNVKERAELLLDQYRKKASLYRSNAVLAPLGDDFRYLSLKEAEAQYTNYQLMFDYINENVAGVHIQFGTLSEYFRAARETFDGPVPVLKGSFFTYSDVNEDYWSGYFTSRVFDKALDRQLERVLSAAESMGGTRAELQSPRRALSLFQHHDGVTGTAKNHVVEDYAKRIHEAIAFTQQWMIQKSATTAAADGTHSLRDLLEIFDNYTNEIQPTNEIRPCWVSTAPRSMNQNLCEGKNAIILAYNPLDTDQKCGSVVVGGRKFAIATLPCESPGPAKKSPTSTKFVFDPVSGLMVEPIQEEWRLWKVQSGGAYLFVPGQQDAYDLLANNHTVEKGGFVVTTTFWKRTVVEREVPAQFGGTATAIDFIYETDLRFGNQEWFARFNSAVANKGYFHTDLNGFDFDTHRFRHDMPIQSQVFPMPTLASIQDGNLRMTVLSEHAQGTASLQDGSIDIWLDRRLDQDDGRGLGQGVQDNQRTRTRLRVLLEREGFDPVGEFDVTPFGRRMWDELQHPLEMFGKHKEDVEEVRTLLSEAKKQLEDSRTGFGREHASKDRVHVAPVKSPPIMEKSRDVTMNLHTFDNTIVPFVFMVFKREDYLKSAIESLRNSDFPRDRISLIISHDGRVPDIVEYVESLKSEFQLVQLFHPHSCYDNKDTFPGDDPKLNEGYKGDAYGNPRSSRVTCCKHHFTWLLKTVFSFEDFMSKNIDTFLFLEEDYIVAPTIYQAIVGGLNAMDEFESETRRGFLGLSLDPTIGNTRKLRPNIDPDAWYGAQFLSGPMTLHRSTFEKLQQNASSFCGLDGYDEYNWDWSFVHMQVKELIPHTVLFPAQPLAKHIGIEGGLHGHKKVPRTTKEEFEKLDSHFLGTKLSGTPIAIPSKTKMKLGYGGWGHPADQEHCMKLLTTPS